MKLQDDVVIMDHESLEQFWLACDATESSRGQGDTVEAEGQPKDIPGNAEAPRNQWLFTDNETNRERHPGLPSESDLQCHYAGSQRW